MTDTLRLPTTRCPATYSVAVEVVYSCNVHLVSNLLFSKTMADTNIVIEMTVQTSWTSMTCTTHRQSLRDRRRFMGLHPLTILRFKPGGGLLGSAPSHSYLRAYRSGRSSAKTSGRSTSAARQGMTLVRRCTITESVLVLDNSRSVQNTQQQQKTIVFASGNKHHG